jgi:hypothetical protein
MDMKAQCLYIGTSLQTHAPSVFTLPGPAGRRGFALVVTISILVLLAVVSVGLLSLSSLTVRTAAASRHESEARANARLALVLAIGDLQMELGPDQRVTARAGILDDNTESPAADGVTNPHWMGSWQSWDDWLNNPDITDTYTKGRSQSFRRWLVSHPDPDAVTELALAREEATSGRVTLVSSRSSNGEVGSDVQVPTVGTPTGRYAWWITGENQKALITTAPEPSDQAGKLHARSHWPNAGVDWLSGLESAPTSNEVIERAATLATYGLAGADSGFPEELNSHFHDLTVDSLGLATNVRDGGLKKDLNLLLEQRNLPTIFGTYSSRRADGTIVPIRDHRGYLPSPTYAQNLNFSSWYKLHQYYQLYRGGGDETADDCAPVPFIGSGIWGSAQAPNINFNWHRQNLDYYGIGRTPIVTRLMLVFSTRRVPSADGRSFDYKLGVNPVVVLWNPYTLPLHSPRLWIQITPGALQYKAYVNGQATVNWSQLRRSNGPFELNIYPMEAPNAQTTPIILMPGETRIYSAVSGFVSTPDNRHAELYPGYQPPDAGGGFEVDLGGLTGLPGNSRVELAMRLDDQRAHHGGQYQVYWTVRNAQTGESQRYNEMAANPVEDGKPIYLAEDLPGERILFSNSSRRVPFSSFQFIMKSGEDLRNPGTDYSDQDFRCRNFIHANPVNQRAMYGEATPRMRGLSQYHVQIQRGSGNALNPDFEHSTNRAYTGSAVSPGNSAWPGQTNVTLNEFPVVPVTSIASLMHFKLNPGDTRDFASGRHLWEVSANQALGIGNSFAHPLLPGDAIYQDVPDAACRGNPLQMKLARDFHDHAYLNNDALWDDWFCSGITREDEGLFQTGRSLRQVVEEFEENGTPLQNPHLVPWTNALRESESLTSKLVSGAQPNRTGYETAARYLLLNGAFNINSTSVDAWKAVLSGLRDEEIVYIDHETGNVRTAPVPGDRVVLSRFSLPASPREGADPGDPDSWLGVRTLTPEQIDRLAQECVRQVKERGPFLNLSDFINRRLANDETGVCGALQAAIDWDEFLGRSPAGGDDESINGRFKNGDDYISSAKIQGWDLPFPAAATGSRFAGIPGYLTQADLLKRIGNMISPRDDTFRIRAYGEATDANGIVQARAWCEAVVQRTPDYLDPADNPEYAFARLRRAVNRTFGRQLRVVSFRWLSKAEV